MRSFAATDRHEPSPTLGWVGSTLSLVGLCFCLFGCQATPSAQFPTVRGALEQLLTQTSCSRGVVGDAKLTVDAPFTKKVTGDLLYKVSEPNKIRFDIYSSFGVTLNTLTSDGRHFSLYDLANESFFYGPAKTCNLARFTRVNVSPFALAEILRGRPPVLEHKRSRSSIQYATRWFGGGRYVVDLEGANETRQRLEIAVARADFEKPLRAQRLRLMSARVEQRGRLLYQVKLEGHAVATRAPVKPTAEELEMGVTPLPPSGPECSAELPRRIVFSVPGTGANLTIDNREIAHNPPVAPGSFGQQVPDGVSSAFSDCVD